MPPFDDARQACVPDRLPLKSGDWFLRQPRDIKTKASWTRQLFGTPPPQKVRRRGSDEDDEVVGQRKGRAASGRPASSVSWGSDRDSGFASVSPTTS